MDLAFIKGNNKLSVRVGLILQYKNEILLLKKDSNNYYVLPGGHVKFGEFLEESIKREIKEELALDIEPEYYTFLENFYTNKFFRHEYFFIFRSKLNNKLKLTQTIEGLEKVEWIDLKERKDIKIYPNSLKEILNTNEA